MRLPVGRIGFYGTACVCNVMVWGMFSVLNMPRIDAAVLNESYQPPTRIHQTFTATVGKPVELNVAAVGVHVPVQDGAFDPVTGEWTLSDSSAYFALPSVPSNDSNGTTIIYGHAKPGMFEPLINLQAGASANVRTDIGKTFTYEYVGMREVDPSDTTVFNDNGPPTLVLQTCSGPWDIYRALYEFKYTGLQAT